MGNKKADDDIDLRQRVKDLECLGFQIHKMHEEDRWSVSSMLHDNVLQVLNVAHMNVEKMLRTEANNSSVPIDKAAALVELRSQIAEAIEQTQELMHEISSPVLRYLGLTAALKWVADKYAESGRMNISVREQGCETRSLPNEVKSAAFLATRDLIRSIEMNPAVRALDITVDASATEVEVGVTGFNPELIRKSWKSGLPERLVCFNEQYQSLGGGLTLRLESDDQSEKHILIRIPIPQGISGQNE